MHFTDQWTDACKELCSRQQLPSAGGTLALPLSEFGFVVILFIGKQCNLQNLIDMFNKDNFKIFQDIGWNIRQVLFIVLRE